MPSVASPGAVGGAHRNLWLRLGSAALLIPLVAAIIWLGGAALALLVAAVGVLTAREYLQLALGRMTAAELPALCAFALLPLLASHAAQIFWLLAAASVASWLINLLRGDIARGPIHAAHASAAMLFLAPALLAILLLRARHGFWGCASLLAVVWVNDGLAYLVGHAVGTHHFAPGVSPGKTLEGLAAGSAGSIATALALASALELGLAEALLVGAAIAIVAPLGDLSKSLLKRSVGAKESGHLIPGHGGLLDRLDSLLFSAPLLLGMLELLPAR